jgi:hypothetical protein
MAKVKSALTSTDQQKDAVALSKLNAIHSENKPVTKKFKSLVIWVDHKNLEVKDLWRDAWYCIEFNYQFVKQQRTYHIGKSETGFSSKHNASLQLLLSNYPFCKVRMIPNGEFGNSRVEISYQDNQKIIVQKGVATMSADSIDGVMFLISSLRYANHLGTDFKIIDQGDDSAIVRFNKKKKG